MSKKILSLALVVVMLLSICSITANAAVGSGKSVGIRVETDAEIGAPAGSLVNVSVYYEFPEGTDEVQMAVGNIALGYDNTVYATNTDRSAGASLADDARTWGVDIAPYMKSTAHVTDAGKITTNIVKKFNANDTAKGWNTALQVQMVYDGVNASQSTGFPVANGAHIFTLQFKTLKTLTAKDVIGVVEGAYGQSFFKVQYMEGTSTKTFAVDTVDMTEAAAVAPAEAAKVVAHKATQIQWANEAKTDVNLGFKGEFKKADIAIDFAETGKSTNVTSVGAKITFAGAETTSTTGFVYTPDGGTTYQFRAVFGALNVATQGDAEVKVEYFVVKDGNTYWSDPVTTTANAHTSRLPA